MVFWPIQALQLFSPMALALQQCFSPGDVCWSFPKLKKQNYFGSEYHIEPSPTPLISGNCHTVNSSAETFCTFSSQSFAGGLGLSIVTKPDRAEKFQQLPVFTDPDAFLFGMKDRPPPPFEKRDIPRKGRGIVSNKTLYRGDLIYSPILILDSEAVEYLDTQHSLRLEHAAVKDLPPKTQEIFWDLYGQLRTDPVRDRIYSNGFVLKMNGVLYHVIYIRDSRE